MRPLVALAATALLASGPALAAPTFDGAYTLVPAASDDVHKAIDRTVSGLNFFLRPIAKPRLEGTNEPYKRIVFDLSGKTVSIALDGRAPIVTPADGRAIKWKREDGEVFDVSTRFKGPALEERFVADDGTRVNTFTLGPDGRLTMHVAVSSDKLPEPLTYKLVYQRAK